MLERHEPLYRYFKYLPTGCEPLSNVMADIEIMTKMGYLKNSGQPGTLQVVSTPAVTAEVKQRTDVLGEKECLYHAMYQAIEDKMFISVSAVSNTTSKTVLALCIDERDTVSIDYMAYDHVMANGLFDKKLWNSISTVVKQSDGALKRGFVRVETTFQKRNSELGIKCDFKLSRAKPIYILMRNLDSSCPSAATGTVAKEWFETQVGAV